MNGAATTRSICKSRAIAAAALVLVLATGCGGDAREVPERQDPQGPAEQAPGTEGVPASPTDGD